MLSARRGESSFGQILLMLAVVALGAGIVKWASAPAPAGGPSPAGGSSRTGNMMDYDWRVKAADGSIVDVSALKGRPAFVNVWATWCGPCRAEIPSIDNLYRTLAPEGVGFLLVSNEDHQTVQSFAAKNGLAVPVFTTGSLPRSLTPRGIPRTYIVDAQGRIVYDHTGSARWDDPKTVAFIRNLLPQAGAAAPTGQAGRSAATPGG